MSGVRNLKPGKAVAFPVFLFVLLAFANVSFARSYNFPLVSIEAEIQSDGSMQVTEERTVEFNGRYTGLYQYIIKQPGVSISDVKVKEGGTVYERHHGTTYGPAGTYYVIDEPGRLYVDWSFIANNEVRTFTVHYKVMGAVEVHDDVADFYWQFIGDEWEATTKRARVRLTLPPGAQDEEVLAWGHGPLHGTVSIESPTKIAWEVSPLPPGDFSGRQGCFSNAISTGCCCKDEQDRTARHSCRREGVGTNSQPSAPGSATRLGVGRACHYYRRLYGFFVLVALRAGVSARF
jgi:uncharacterized membrane protein